MEKEKTLGRCINIARKDRGFTAEQLSEKCSINPTYLRQIECGAKMPSLPVFISLCNALNVSPSYLLQGETGATELFELHELEALWKTAAPESQRLVAAMLKAALKQLEDA